MILVKISSFSSNKKLHHVSKEQVWPDLRAEDFYLIDLQLTNFIYIAVL